MFALEFGERAEAMIFGFERKTHDPAKSLLCAKCGDDVFRFDQMQLERLTCLGDFAGLDVDGAIITRGGGPDQAVAIFKYLAAGGKHFLGRDHGHNFSCGRVGHLHGARDDHHIMPECKSGFRQRRPHAAA
jgi:hypothetical protein